MADNLLTLRHRIDALDSEILGLLNERAQCAEAVAIAKKASSKEGETVCFYRPEREAQILRRMVEENTGPLKPKQITKIYRDIISSCLALEECLQIAYLGPEGTFTQSAVNKHFGRWIDTLPQESIEHVFQEVSTGRAHFGVIPIENSTGGVVTHTLDMFIHSDLQICAEVHLPIHQNLLSLNTDWQQCERIYSHQQSLAQCKKWLQHNLPNASLIPVASNAEAARLASKDAQSAAIAGISAAKIYNLQVLQKNIEDLANNTTRFLIIGNDSFPSSGDDKTSLMISTKNEPGSLFRLLKPLADHGLDMSRIESRPSQSANWDYVFFLDINGHRHDPEVNKALGELEEHAALLRILGSYPKAIL
ncbi:MAG: prephenate dehydratase [Thiotrichaceae bacterium]|nr:prephenate dehydratase [Thiotrichaceae bacterium]